MCHGAIKGSKTIRYKVENPRHKNAIPYKRRTKYKDDYTDRNW